MAAFDFLRAPQVASRFRRRANLPAKTDAKPFVLAGSLIRSMTL